MYGNTRFWDELAIQSYRTILKSKPNSALIHNNLGLAYVRIGKLNKAIRSFQRAIKCDPQYLDAHYHLGATCQKVGDLKGAARHLSRYKKLRTERDDKPAPDVQELLDRLELHY